MFQVRIHGRGGQGVVTAAEMLSVAAFDEGRHAQAFPSFGSERMGAPVVAFCRIDDKEIRLREPIMEPDAIIIQDPTLLHQVDVFAGLKKDGYILINTSKTFDQLGLGDFVRDWHRRAAVHRAGDGTGAEACRPARCPTCRCSAASPRWPACCNSSRWSRRSTSVSPARWPLATSPRRARPTRIVKAEIAAARSRKETDHA